MKLLFSLSWSILVVAPPPTIFAMVATAKKTTKHAKKNKTSDVTSDGFVPVKEPPIDQVGARQLDCDPRALELLEGKGCEDNDCANPLWGDGCEACMCFNPGNAAWCDGHRDAFYDTYFEEHGENPWGDTNVRNRKCNTDPAKKKDEKCEAGWQCANGCGSFISNRHCY